MTIELKLEPIGYEKKIYITANQLLLPEKKTGEPLKINFKSSILFQEITSIKDVDDFMSWMNSVSECDFKFFQGTKIGVIRDAFITPDSISNLNINSITGTIFYHWFGEYKQAHQHGRIG